MRTFVVLVCSVFIFVTTNAQKNRPCTTPNNEAATCKSIYSCNVLYYAVKTKDPKQLEFLRKSQCGYDNQRHEPFVCCGTYDKYDQETDTQNGRRGNGNIGGRSNLVPDRSTCGFQESDRIYNGENTTISEFPWMALLEYSKSSSGAREFPCGGTLISPRYVLTAAHCVTGPIEKSKGRLVNVRLGEWDTRQGRDCIKQLRGQICNNPPLDVPVEKFIFHEQYSPDSKNRYHDIALIRLQREISYSEYVRPLCLPEPTEESRDGEKLIVAGWGRTEASRSSPVKLKVQVPKASKSYCSDKFSTARVYLGDGQVCAGGEANGRDSCTGDSGGPLMRTAMNDSAQWYIEGIVSFGAACGSTDWPAVYTKVSSYLEWIHDTIEP